MEPDILSGYLVFDFLLNGFWWYCVLAQPVVRATTDTILEEVVLPMSVTKTSLEVPASVPGSAGWAYCVQAVHR